MDLSPLSFVGILRGASNAELEGLARSAYRKQLARGQVLFLEGEPSRDVYVVLDGRLKVTVRSPQGTELVLHLLGFADTIGELSVLDAAPRSAGVEAVDRSDLLAVPSEAVRAVLSQSLLLTTNLALDLAASLRRLTGFAADLVLLDLPRRLAKLLLAMAGDEAIVELGMSQADLALRLGVGRQAVNRALASLAQRGWIRVEGTHVQLADRARLERFAGS